MQKDKIQHLVAGFVIAIATYLIVMLLFKSSNDAIYISIFMSALAGYVKERYDISQGRKADWKDFLATVSGGIIATLFIVYL